MSAAETNAAHRESDFFVAMQASHRLLETLFEDLVRAAEDGDHAHLHAVWVQVEQRLLAHLEAEERFVLPAFARTDPDEAVALLREHGRIREQLLAIGIAVELHYARLTRVEEFIASLRAHAAREEKLVYRWAAELLDPELAAAASQHLETASV